MIHPKTQQVNGSLEWSIVRLLVLLSFNKLGAHVDFYETTVYTATREEKS